MMNKKLRGSQVDRFLEAILSLKTKEEARKYLEDVCTVNEILTLAQRHAFAEMLRRCVTYVEI